MLRKKEFFASKIIVFEYLFDLIKGWNYYTSTSAPIWGRELFRGINMKPYGSSIIINHMSFGHIDFSYSYLKNLSAFISFFSFTNFSECVFDQVDFNHSHIVDARFDNIKQIRGSLNLVNCVVIPNTVIPFQLAETLRFPRKNLQRDTNDKNRKVYVCEYGRFGLSNYFNTIKGFLVYGLANKLFTKAKIKSWFRFDSQKSREEFNRLLINLKYTKKQK